jgi:hypothetical protein
MMDIKALPGLLRVKGLSISQLGPVCPTGGVYGAEMSSNPDTTSWLQLKIGRKIRPIISHTQGFKEYQ